MECDIFQVAAFTDKPFGGNPAAVVMLEEWLDVPLMQRIAAENNLSETAFLVSSGDSEWQIRWFTPTVEVPLCGHATLASAAVIRSQLQHTNWPITLHSASGPLRIATDGDRFVLDLPANKPVPVDLPDGIERALGGADFSAGMVSEAHIARDIYLVVLSDEAAVAGLAPDFAALGALIEHGVIVSAVGDDVDIVSRFFAPSIGIDEDPVTGAAHCVLTPFWAERLGKKVLSARQISSRVGDLICEDQEDRVKLTGAAVFFMRGVISV